MQVEFFPFEERYRPVQKTKGAAGFDLTAAEGGRLGPGEWKAVPCGFIMVMEQGLEGQIRPRSGLALKHWVTVLKSPVTIDSDYRLEVKVILMNHSPLPFTWLDGDRIAQLVVCPCLMLGEGERAGGFGSTGV